MALTGLEIYKLLPQTNCKDCGFPTCLAFAMKLAQKGTELSKCPHVTPEAIAKLEAAASPPVRLVKLGEGDRAFEVGNEVVLFRHEKMFYHRPGIMVRVRDDDPALAEIVTATAAYEVERVGLRLRLDGVVLQHASGDVEAFAAAAAVAAATPAPLALISEEPHALAAGVDAARARRPLVGPATAATWREVAALAAEHGLPVLARGDGDLGALAQLTEQIRQTGVQDMILDPGARDAAALLSSFTQLRRLALKKNIRALGYPLLAWCGRDDFEDEIVMATLGVAKYVGILVVDRIDPAFLYPLVTWRQNLYTDPQKPIQVDPRLYEVGTPDADSPLLITTNFSLTYFTVSGEVEASGMPAWLLVADADGQSVLTGWAAGKFDADKIAKTVKDASIGDRLNHTKLVIPGHVASLSGEIEEELPGWKVLVGPREAADLPSYLKNIWGSQ